MYLNVMQTMLVSKFSLGFGWSEVLALKQYWNIMCKLFYGLIKITLSRDKLYV